MVDLGVKSEGIIPKKEFDENKVQLELKVSVKVKILSACVQPFLSYMKVIEETK